MSHVKRHLQPFLIAPFAFEPPSSLIHAFTTLAGSFHELGVSMGAKVGSINVGNILI